MVVRKRFFNSIDISQLKAIQRRLPAGQKMRVFLCHAGEELFAGGICSAIGDTALYLFGATSNRGLTGYASYLVHWNMLAWAKGRDCSSYDLNGVDPVRNAGGYQFKSQLAGRYGRQVAFVGQYDVYSSLPMKALIMSGDSVRRRLTFTRRMLARFGQPFSAKIISGNVSAAR
jgi:lipid II:glycine glycyltransferase (peptidoglycan interpeptide bridge formation enzyme)